MASKVLILIRITSSQGGSRLHMVGAESFCIGRSSESEVIITSASISRKHLSVSIAKGNVVQIEDLGSSNGSFIDGHRMEPNKKRTLESNVSVTLGTGGDSVAFYLMERPVEFDDYSDLLRGFNQNILKEADLMRKEAFDKADKEVKIFLDLSKKEILAQVEQARVSYQERLNTELTQFREQSLAKVTEDIQKEKVLKIEEMGSELREYANQFRLKAQVDADSILQNADKESARLKQEAALEFDRLMGTSKEKSSQMLTHAEKEAEKIVSGAREAGDSVREKARKTAEEALELSQQQGQMIIQQAKAEADRLLEERKKQAVSDAEKIMVKAVLDIEMRKLQHTESEKAVARLAGEVAEFQGQKNQLIHDIESMRMEQAVLVEKNTKQLHIKHQIEQVEHQLKTLELQKAQIHEQNEQSKAELESLKRTTLEELDRLRKSEEQKVITMASSKAKEFSEKIEKTILSGLNLKSTLDTSRIISGQLVEIFAEESFKRTEANSDRVTEQGAMPKVMKNRMFQITCGIALLMGGAFLYDQSRETVIAQDKFMQKVVNQRNEEMRFQPKMTENFRSTYTDNVLYMSKYLELKLDPRLQDQWALELNEFFLKNLKLSEENMVRFIGLETSMIKRLSTLRDAIDARHKEEGITRLREVEKEETKALLTVLRTNANLERLRMREKNFLAQALLNPLRGPAEATTK